MGTLTSPLTVLKSSHTALSSYQIPANGFQTKSPILTETGTAVWNHLKNPNTIATTTVHPFIISPPDLSLDPFLMTCSSTQSSDQKYFPSQLESS